MEFEPRAGTRGGNSRNEEKEVSGYGKMGDERFKSLANCFRERGDQRDCAGKLRNNYPLVTAWIA
jgi:hypothetical protein